MNREQILELIRQTAKENGGVPLGTHRLAQLGVTPTVWEKHWARISDAQREAGLTPNKPQGAHPDEDALARLASLAQELRVFPTLRDIKLKGMADREFPSPRVFKRLGPKALLASRLADFARTHPAYAEVAELCSAHIQVDVPTATRRTVQFGSVYLLRGPGRRFKIGRTNAFGRRKRELSIQLPFETRKIHVIETDDPEGIESYWHQRFAAKRINSEWFELDANDVAAFKRWKRLK